MVKPESKRRKTSRLDEIVATLRAQMPELQESYGVRSLALFGSYVRGDQKVGSDLDLLVEFDDRPLTLLEIIHLENLLGDLLGVKVDLVEKQALKPGIGEHILAEAVPV